MAKPLRIEILGDVKGYTNALHKAAAETTSFGSKAGHALLAFGKAAVIATGAAAAAAAVVGEKSVKAAIAAQEANDKLTQALKNQKSALDATSPAILKAEEASRQLGFANSDTREALTKLIQSGHDWKDTADLMGVAQDMARAKGVGLVEATSQLVRMQAGNARVGKEYGIVLDFLTAKQWKAKAAADGLTVSQEKGRYLTEQVTQKVKDQAQVFADSAAGGIQKFHASLTNLEENLGSALAPVVGRAADALAGFIDKFDKAQGASAKFHVVVAAVTGAATDIFNSVKRAIDSVDWAKVWADVKVNAAELIAKFDAALARADWGRIGKGIGNAIIKTVQFSADLAGKLTHELAIAASKVDWKTFIIALGKGIIGSGDIGDKLKRVLLLNFKIMNPTALAIQSGLIQKAHGVVEKLGSALSDTSDWSKTSEAVRARAAGAMHSAINKAVAQTRPVASAGGAQIGGALTAGAAAAVRANLYAVAAAVVAMVTTSIAAGMAAARAQSPSKETAEKIGLPMAQGVAVGIRQGIPQAVAAAQTGVQQIVTGWASAMATRASEFARPLAATALKIVAAVNQIKPQVMAAFKQLAQDALSAFDAVTAAWVPPAQKILDKMQIEDQINQAVQAVADAQSAVDQAVAQLNADLAAGPQAGESEADYQARVEQDKANIAKAVADLGAAQRSYTETQLALQAAQQQAAHDKQRAAQREHLAGELLDIQAYLAKHPGEYEKVQKKILEVLKKYKIPMFNAGQLLASKFTEGMSSGLEHLLALVRELEAMLVRIGNAASPPSSKKPPGGGGGRGSTASVGAAGLGGATYVTVNMPNYLGEPRAAAQQIRAEIMRLGRENAINPLAV